MKYLMSLCVLVGVSISSTFALSFAPDTIFLDADDKAACEEQGGSFTKWYDETYCTTTAHDLLTENEQEKVMHVATKIVDLIGHDQESYDEVMSLLQNYHTFFMEERQVKKLAIVHLLTEHISMHATPIPDTCTVWFDGCNTCQVMEDGELACTKMACFVQETPMCKVHEKVIIVADHTEMCTGVGPMDCLLIKDAGANRDIPYMQFGDITGETNEDTKRISCPENNENCDQSENAWTYFYDSIEGFDYIPGYQWTLLVEETHLDPATVPADASSISWSLKEVLAITAPVPDTCDTWFDGCNTCSVGEDGVMACTLMACMGEPLVPYCMDEGSDNTKATDYNSSRSNKSF